MQQQRDTNNKGQSNADRGEKETSAVGRFHKRNNEGEILNKPAKEINHKSLGDLCIVNEARLLL